MQYQAFLRLEDRVSPDPCSKVKPWRGRHRTVRPRVRSLCPQLPGQQGTDFFVAAVLLLIECKKLRTTATDFVIAPLQGFRAWHLPLQRPCGLSPTATSSISTWMIDTDHLQNPNLEEGWCKFNLGRCHSVLHASTQQIRRIAFERPSPKKAALAQNPFAGLPVARVGDGDPEERIRHALGLHPGKSKLAETATSLRTRVGLTSRSGAVNVPGDGKECFMALKLLGNRQLTF